MTTHQKRKRAKAGGSDSLKNMISQNPLRVVQMKPKINSSNPVLGEGLLWSIPMIIFIVGDIIWGMVK